MKKYNKYLNIFNIFYSLAILIILAVTYFSDTYLYMVYESFSIALLKITPIAIITFNVIISIVNLKKKNKKNGIIHIVIAASWLIYMLSDFTELILMIICLISVILSIINLIFNKEIEDKKTKIPIVLFWILIIMESFFIITPIVMFIISVNNLKEALPKLKEEVNMETYVYNKDGVYVYLDNQGNKLTQKHFESIASISYPSKYMVSLLIDEHEANVGFACKDNKLIVINSQGEEMFSICNLFDDYFDVAVNFMNCITQGNILGIQSISSVTNYDRNENNLRKYTELTQETKDLFEDNKNAEYMYFKNDELLLQVVMKNNEIEDDTKLLETYVKFTYNSKLYRDIRKIQEFYANKKEYYLLDIENGIKKQLKCNNLIYEAYYTSNDLYEEILVYSNGSIPFYDTEETGYFEKNGEKRVINKDYIVEDINENYIVLLNQETGETIFLSLQTGQIEQKIQNPVMIYSNFYIQCPSKEGDEYKILDKNLNEVCHSYYMPRLLGRRYIINNTSEVYSIYYYDKDNIKLIDEVNSYEFFDINAPAVDLKEKGSTVYSMLGILD